MRTTFHRPSLVTTIAVLAILGHLAAFVLWVTLPSLEAPPVAIYGFLAAWLAVLVLAIRWIRTNPARSVLFPAVGLALATVIRLAGEQLLGWRG